jgi:hypothetical protein
MNKYLDLERYWNKGRSIVNKVLYEHAYDREAMHAIELEKFKKANLDYDKGLMKLDRVLSQLGKPDFNSHHGYLSVHWLLFCSISEAAFVKDILEIGTFDAETALFLSKVFPQSKIDTLDVPEDDPIFINSYRRGDAQFRQDFIEKRNKNISSPQINYMAKNSFFVPGMFGQKFDLIWVDGGHLYPEVAWDICNCYHLCKPGGWLMCDDVIIEKDGLRNDYVSPDSHHVLEYLAARTNEEVIYFLKRENPVSSANPKRRKYVALIRKK